MTTTDTPQERQPAYRDRQLHQAFRELRKTIKPDPAARQALANVESRLRYLLRVLETSDKAHAERCELFLQFGLVERANTEASLIWDSDTRAALLARCPIGIDQHNRIAEAQAMGREVLR